VRAIPGRAALEPGTLPAMRPCFFGVRVKIGVVFDPAPVEKWFFAIFDEIGDWISVFEDWPEGIQGCARAMVAATWADNGRPPPQP